MKTLNSKIEKAILYLMLSIVIAIVLPIFLENAWACLVGIAAAALFIYQIAVYYKALKNNNFTCIRARCVKKSRNGLGAATYAEKCFFKPEPDSPVKDVIELQIVTENSALVGDKYQSKKKKKKTDAVYVGSLYELIFSNIDAENEEYLSADDFTNANFIAFSLIQEGAEEEKKTESVDEEKIEKNA